MQLLRKSFKVNGWLYEYTPTGIQITNPEGQKIGKPVPLPKQGYFASDPWDASRKAAERKAEKDAAAQEIIAQQGRITAAKAKREQPKFDKPYIYSGPFWR